MQNSLSRLLEGMAHTLHRAVLPNLEDDYARAQVLACIEIMGNLETRVTWTPEHAERRVRRLVDTIADVAPDLPDDPDLAAVRAVAAEASRGTDDQDGREVLQAFADLQRWLAGTPGHPAFTPVTEAVAADLREELDRLRTARFGR